MMESAQGHQVLHAGFTALSPVFDMVSIRVVILAATREAATAITYS